MRRIVNERRSKARKIVSGLLIIPEGYVVHHINGNPADNSPGNLVVLSRSEHSRIHRAKIGIKPIVPCYSYHEYFSPSEKIDRLESLIYLYNNGIFI